MCQEVMPRTKHRGCGHEIEELPFVVECEDAKNRGSQCEAPKPNHSMGMKTLSGKCPDCEAKDKEAAEGQSSA